MPDQPAPDFELPATGGKTFRLSSARGENLVLYFYPKDNTPGCTREGEQFAELYPQFRKHRCEVYGISRDSLKSHENFKARMRFPFELLSDAQEAVCKQFDVIKMKSMYGKKYMGVERTTFVIGPDGKIRKVFTKVKPAGHAAQVMEALGS